MSTRLLLFLIFISAQSYSQNMQEGFEYLETGMYAKATTFFNTILSQYPENKTANLCYGRAIGLSGKTKEALLVFTKLKQKYPQDFEIKLNYAEALLWANQFDNAENEYQKLVVIDSTSFSAVLGYANALSNVKKYKEALTTVNKALQIKEGNKNALNSRKYIRLGYAYKLSQDQQYDKAFTILDNNLKDFPNDRDTQLNKINYYLINDSLTKAEETYAAIIEKPKDSILFWNGMALISHKRNHEKKALKISNRAIDKVEYFKKDSSLYVATHERNIQALLWNNKYKEAKNRIEILESTNGESNTSLAQRASYAMYTSRFKKSIDYFKTMIANTENSFDGNLGIANAYRAEGDIKQSYKSAFRTLQYFPKQKDAEDLVNKLNKSNLPYLEHKTSYSFDNGDNNALSSMLKLTLPVSFKLTPMFKYSYRDTENTISKNHATSHNLSTGLEYKMTNKTSLSSSIGMTSVNSFSKAFSISTIDVLLKTIPFRLQILEIGFKRNIQDFNADLLDQNIVMNNYYMNYNLSTTFNLGWYSQVMHTTQTDSNNRNLFFSSLYYKITQKPILKAGLNYQYISFANQVPLIYFSPKTYNLGEVFVALKSIQDQKLIYNASTAIGRQTLGDSNFTTTYRVKVALGYHFSYRFKASFYGQYSNIASATAAGFEYTELGFKLKWFVMKAPIFQKKILDLKKL